VVVVQGHIVFIPVGECIQVHFLCRRVHSSAFLCRREYSSGGCIHAYRISRMARTLRKRCIYGIFGREITKLRS